jgi:hypothetical protein
MDSILTRQFEKVDECLKPVLIKLQTLRSELQDLRSDRDLGRLTSPRLKSSDMKRLSVYQAKLQQFENGKVDGSFRDETDGEKIPRGQAVLDAILSECFCIVAEIQT